MIRIYDLNLRELLLISLILTLTILIIPIMVIVGIILLSLILLFYKLDTHIILPFIVISFLIMSLDYLGNFRVYINLFIISLLIIMFLSEYGLEFNKYLRLPRGILGFVIFLAVTLIISTIFSNYLTVSFFATIRIFVFLFICYLFFSLIEDMRDMNYIIYSLIAAMILTGIPLLIDLYHLGIQNFFIRGLLEDKYNLIAPKGFTSKTIFFISFTLLIALLIKNKNIKIKIVLWLLILINSLLLILANSRGGILAAVISTTVLLLMVKPNIFFRVFLTIVTLFISLYTLSDSFRETFEAYLRLGTVDQRVIYWNMGLEIIKDNPVFGIGPNTFYMQFFNYAPSSYIQLFNPGFSDLGNPHPHNFFLYYFAENGILGFIVAILFFIIFFYYAFITFKISQKLNSELYILTAVIFSIGIGTFVRSFIEISGYLTYGYITTDLPFWLLFIILLKINTQLRYTPVPEMRK